MISKSGFVLLTVVVMLSVITSLILAQNKMIQLAMRRQHLYVSYQLRESELEAIAERLALSVILAKAGIHSQSAHCTPLRMDPSLRWDDTAGDDKMLQKHLIQQGHDYANYYRYLITDLGDYPCMKLSGSHASHHWLLSILDTQTPTKILQLRIASPIPDLPCTNHSVSYYPSRVLSWRLMIINLTNTKIN